MTGSIKSASALFDKELAEALCNLQVPRQIKFSPDGSKLVYSTGLQRSPLRKGKHEVSTLWLSSTLEAGSARKLTSGESNDTSHVWHPDGNRIIFLSDRNDPGGNYSIWTLRLDGGDALLISGPTSASIASFALSPDGTTIAFTSSDERNDEQKKKEKDNGGAPDPKVWGDDAHLHAKLRLLELETGKITTQDTGRGHVYGFSWSPDSKSLVFTTVRNLDPEEALIMGTPLSIIDIESGIVRALYTVNRYANSLTWGPDGKIYYINLAVKDEFWYAHAVYSLDPTNLDEEPVKVITGEEDEPVSLKLVCDKLLVLRNVRNGTLVSDISGTNVFKRPLDFHSYDAHYDSKACEWIIAAALSDINMPTEVFLINKDQPDIKLSKHGKSLESQKFGTFHLFTCPSSDGAVELDGIYLTPDGQTISNGTPDSPLPTAVFIHGGPMDRNHNKFDNLSFYWIPYLLAKGYGVLLPQYRGSTGRGSRFAGYSSTCHGRENYDDIITTTQEAIDKGFADRQRLLVGGWSMGGIMTYLCSVRNGLHGLGWRFNAAIAGAGICDFDSAMLASDVGSTGQAQLGGGMTPWTSTENDTTARRGSALWQVLKAVQESRRTGVMVIPPMLILHGEQDTRAPFTQSQGFRRALRTHNLPFESVSYPGQGHSIGPMSHWIDMLERVARYCDTYIGPGYTPEN